MWGDLGKTHIPLISLEDVGNLNKLGAPQPSSSSSSILIHPKISHILYLPHNAQADRAIKDKASYTVHLKLKTA